MDRQIDRQIGITHSMGIVFEMLSMNLYELLCNTQFQGVSLHLIAKFFFFHLSDLIFSGPFLYSIDLFTVL